MDYKSSFSKKRSLSKFLAQELLYDYVSDRLDEERKSAVTKALDEDSELKEEEQAICAGLEYLSKLSKTSVAEPLVEKITQDPSWFLMLQSSLQWKKWPEPVKWFAEALVASVAVGLVAFVIPWSDMSWFKASDESLLLIQDQKVSIFKPVNDDKANEAKANDNPPLVVEEPAQPEKPVEVAAVVEKPAPQVFNKSEEKKSQAPKAKKIKKGNAFVYRAFMNIENTAEKSPKITEILMKYGAEKAGQVKLGWEKPNGNYFHFSIPEKNYDLAIKEIKTFGSISLSKTQHRRVMPEGVVRVILWVKESGEQ